MLLLARRLSELGPLASACTQQSVRILQRTFSDKPEVPNTTGNLDTSGATDKPESVAKINVNKTEKEILQIVNESNEVSMNKRHDNKLFFTNEEKALMKDSEQRIPYTVEKEPGVFCYENTVRPLVTFPDPTLVNLESHEDVREYTLGFPVIRPPSVVERWREGIRFTKSTPEEYPWIQEFKSQYDYLIVGGGIVGSCIANALAERIKCGDGFRVGVIEKDPTYRQCNSTQMLGGLRNQFTLPESVEAGLYAGDFLRLIQLNRSVPNDMDEVPGMFNTPNVKFQPHGNLTLVTEENLESLEAAHKTQGMCGAHTAILTKKQLEQRFPWLNTNGLGGGCLGLEGEGWFDTWNMLQSIILRNKYLGVDYIHGEVMYVKRHAIHQIEGDDYRPFETHVFIPNSKKVYPIEFSKLIVAAAGQSGNIGRMAGIGQGKGPLYMDIPVEPRRGYIFEIKCSGGPGLNSPLVSDPSGLFIRRNGLIGHYLVSKLPDPEEPPIPENMFGDVDPEYFEKTILPLLQYRIPGFSDYTLIDSRPVDFDLNYFDGTPIVGLHPILDNIFMATGFNGRGPTYGPAVGRGIAELLLDDGYQTIDFSRFSFDRFLNKVELREEIYA